MDVVNRALAFWYGGTKSMPHPHAPQFQFHFDGYRNIGWTLGGLSSFESGEFQFVRDLLKRMQDHLDAGKPALMVELSPEERALARPLFLLSDKPTIFACNVKESDLGTADTNPYVMKVRDYVRTHADDAPREVGFHQLR